MNIQNFIFILVLFVSTMGFSQKIKKVYLDIDFKPTKKKELIEYYRTIQKTDSGFVVLDYFMNDQIQMKGLFSDKELEVYNGNFVWYFENGNISTNATYVNDRYDGEKRKYYESGQLQSISTYVEGSKQGRFEEYYENGEVRELYWCVNGEIEGRYLKFYPNNSEMSIANFKNGNLRGEAKRFYPSGKVFLYMYTNDLGSGEMTLYYENGQVKMQVPLLLGYQKGTLIEYDETGKIIRSEVVNEFTKLEEDRKKNQRSEKTAETIRIHFFSIPFDSDEKGMLVDSPDVDAIFPGGVQAMQLYIAKNVRYPKKAIRLGIQGKVYVSFVVETDGSISNVEVERGNYYLRDESMRLIRSMPNWIPGQYGGKNVRVRCRIPINYTLTSD